MSELKPCPFCGEEEIERDTEMCYGGMHYGVFCSNCGASTDLYTSVERAEEAWNRRAEDGK